MNHEGLTLSRASSASEALHEIIIVDEVASQGDASDLFDLSQIEVSYDPSENVLWSWISSDGRACFNPQLLSDFVRWQDVISSQFGPSGVPLRFLVLGSRVPGVFCYGGDLDLFKNLISNRDREGLVSYAHTCCEILDRNFRSLDIPMLTIGLVQGNALGGGFEALLSFDYVIAERSASFGLPETMFGLFPGMGAHVFLSRKLGSAMAERIISSGETYSAEFMHEIGLVHELVEDGEGDLAAQNFIRKASRRHSGLVSARRAMKVAESVTLDELKRVTEIWADAALDVGEKNLRMVDRLVAAQTKVAIRA